VKAERGERPVGQAKAGLASAERSCWSKPGVEAACGIVDGEQARARLTDERPGVGRPAAEARPSPAAFAPARCFLEAAGREGTLGADRRPLIQRRCLAAAMVEAGSLKLNIRLKNGPRRWMRCRLRICLVIARHRHHCGHGVRHELVRLLRRSHRFRRVAWTGAVAVAITVRGAIARFSGGTHVGGDSGRQ
jgi:hypothetical protein